MYDLIIIGGGPAALSAGIYAARKKINILLLTESFGGQMMKAPLVENYLGVTDLPGFELVQKFVGHLKKFEVKIKEGETVENIQEINPVRNEISNRVYSEKTQRSFKIKTNKNIYQAKTIIIATGKSAKELDVPGGKEFMGKGIVYCATCDAPLFSEKTVAVVGAGDAGMDTAWQLTRYADKIYIINKYPEFKSDDVILQEKIMNHPKIEIISKAEIKEIKGEKFVKKLVYKQDGLTSSPQDGAEKEIEIDGIFVEIGSNPNSAFAKNIVKLNEKKEIIIDPQTNSASARGIFAAGDVTDIIHKQIVVAAGEGAKAALSAYEYLKSQL